jgi:hypothetical protein
LLASFVAEEAHANDSYLKKSTGFRIRVPKSRIPHTRQPEQVRFRRTTVAAKEDVEILLKVYGKNCFSMQTKMRF